MKFTYQKQSLGKENVMPIKIFVGYIIFTFIFFAIGPIKYFYIDSNSYVDLIFFISLFLIIGVMLYNLGIIIKLRRPRRYFPFDILKFIKFSLIYSVFLYLLIVIFDVKNYGFSFSWDIFTENLFNTMAEAYSDFDFISSPARYLASYTNGIEVFALVGGVYYYKKLEPLFRWILFAIVFLHIFDVVFFIGSQKQYIDVVIYVTMPFFINRLQQGVRASRKSKVILIIGSIVFALILGNVIGARKDLWTIRYHSANTLSGAVIDEENFIYYILPSFFADPFVEVMRYLSQGYRGLALCLTLPFEWSAGFGSSFKWMNDFSQWFSVPLSEIENSYPVRMEAAYGIKAYASWHSIFPWFASDFTWFGAIFIVGIFLYYWGKAWKEALRFGTLPSLAMFSHLSIMVMYIPCNNQLFQTRISITTTIMVFFLWFFYHGVPKDEDLDKHM